MLRFILWNAFCLASIANLQAQSVLSSGGRTFASSEGTMDWTLGEVITETYQQDPGYLTQGFHQTFSDSDMGPNIEVYPNPTPDFLNVYHPLKGNYIIEVFNTIGKKVTNIVYSTNQNSSVQEIDLRNYSSTLYLLFIRNIESGKKSTFKIIKD